MPRLSLSRHYVSLKMRCGGYGLFCKINLLTTPDVSVTILIRLIAIITQIMIVVVVIII